MKTMMKKMCAVIAVTTACLFAGGPIELLRGPWLTNPGIDKMSVSFVVPKADQRSFQVEYRLFGSEDGWKVVPVKVTNQVADDKILHYAELTGLAEGKAYEYHLKASDGTATKDKSFRTFNRKQEQHRLFVNSDIHNRSSMLAEMMHIAQRKNCDAYILLGDQIANRMDGPSFPVIFGGFLSDASRETKGEYPLIVTRGNHDARGHNVQDWYKFFPAPENRTWFSFRIGPVWYMILDSADADTDVISKEIFPKQRKWIAEQLETEDCKTATFRVVMLHYPTNSTNARILNITPKPLIGDMLLSKDPTKRIHLVVSGHRHRYTRADAGSAKFKVNSSSLDGKPSIKATEFPYTQIILDGRGNGGVEYNCILLEGTAEKLTVESYDGQKKTLIDHFSIDPEGTVTDLMEVPTFDE